MEIKDKFKEARLFLNRTTVAIIAIVILMLILLTQMLFLQVIRFDTYNTLSRENRVKIIPLPPRRGIIYDRNGVILADNIPSFQLTITPEQVEDMETTLSELQKVITIDERELEEFQRALRTNPRFVSIPIKFQLTEEEVAKFAIHRFRFPGIDVNAHIARRYPLKNLASHAVGYVARINEQELRTLDTTNYKGTSHVGKAGIEKSYESLLHGQVGFEQIEVNAVGRVIRTLERTPPVPGNNIYLTIDSRLQLAAEKAIGDHYGSVIAVDVSNGELLAFVSTPGYDPNEFVSGLSRKRYKELYQNPFRPMFNRAIRGQYPPGSTIKPFIGLAGLAYNVTDFEKTVYCPGYYMLPKVDHRYRCWKKWGHGKINLRDAIKESCDVYFYDLSYSLGIDNMSTFLGMFGLGKLTGIDLPGEKDGILPSREWKRRARNEPWYHGETLISGIGQGFNLTTPAQLAKATMLLANRGKGYAPHLLKSVQDSTNELIEDAELLAIDIDYKDIVVMDAEWDYIIAGMEDVVHSRKGTARKISKDITYRMAGKTGTAQVYGIKQDEEATETDETPYELRDHALFIAFAPIESPRIAVVIVIEHGGGGSSTAAPIAREVLDSYFVGDQP